MTLPAHAPKQSTVDEALTSFFQAACRAFEQAARPGHERTYRVGSHVLRLRFANDRLTARLTPALEHLASPDNAMSTTPAPSTSLPRADTSVPVTASTVSATDTSVSALTVCVWDSASTGVPLPPPPWPLQADATQGDLRGQSTLRFQADFQFTPADAGVLSILDREQALGMYWLSDERHLPDYETAAPLRNLLHWGLAKVSYQFVHAGAVGRAEGGVLLIGKGGSGKSTIALACLEAGLFYLADDYCLLNASPAPEALSLYNSAKVRPDGLLRFPQLARRVDARDRVGVEKAIFFLQRHFPERLILRFPLQAILIPRLTGLAGTTLTPASPAEALRALAPSTLFPLTGTGPAAFQRLASLIRPVPCYYLEAGTDVRRIPGIIAALLPGE